MKRFILAFFFSCLVNQAHAEMIVVAVTGTDKFMPGEELDPSGVIELSDGARITVLSKSGEMQVLQGPVSGLLLSNLRQAGLDQTMDQWNAVKTILGQPDARSEVFGASRNIDGETPPTPGVWHVSVDSSGPRCTKPSKLTLWRRNVDKSLSISIRNASGNLKDITWEKGQDILPLPNTFPLADGKMVVGIEGELRDLELHVAPASIKEDRAGTLLGWLIEKKCSRQASALIEHVHMDLNIE